jgi:hypothetical protein
MPAQIRWKKTPSKLPAKNKAREKARPGNWAGFFIGFGGADFCPASGFSGRGALSTMTKLQAQAEANAKQCKILTKYI